jgi:hypothetical protein
MKSIYVDLDLQENEVRNVSWEKLAADPSGLGLYNGRHWLNTTTNKKKFYDGTTVHVIADEAFVQAAVQQIGQSQGAFDASAGLLPTVSNLIDGDTVIRRGDYWDISVAGTISGIGGGSTSLSIGDVLKFVGTNPATASQWIGIQRNLNDTLIGNAKTERQTVNLVANTALTVSAATISDVFSVQVYNSAGAEIIIDIDKGLTPNARLLTSKKSLTGVIVDMLGAS